MPKTGAARISMIAGTVITIWAKSAPSPDAPKRAAIAGIAGAAAIGMRETRVGPATQTLANMRLPWSEPAMSILSFHILRPVR
jgi:hypothetical protein